VVLATKKLAATLILALVFSAAAGLADYAAANLDLEMPPVLAMPVEYVNYTIAQVNGTLWAKIDGTYPIYILSESGGAASCVPEELPMVYPMPPDTANIHVWLNGTELAWSDFPYETHHTAIGDWSMVYCDINPVSEFFLLTIHYEHPVEGVNGSSLFLYDLNISPYLTPLSNSSIAYFTVRFEAAVSDIRAYTTFTDSVWNPKDFTVNTGCDAETMSIEMRSVFGEPLAGDLVVMFDDFSAQAPDGLLYWVIAVVVLVVAGLLAVMVYRRKRREKLN
jgi:hypothetical protein